MNNYADSYRGFPCFGPTFDHLMRLFHLQEFYDAYMVLNRSLCAPYHNLLQMRYQVETAWLFWHTDSRSSTLAFNSEIPRLLLLATMFKDINHSGGKLGEPADVTQAILSLQEANGMVSSPVSLLTLKVITSLISGRAYLTDLITNPTVAKTQVPQSFEASVLRDVELSAAIQVFRPYGLDLLYGLYRETQTLARVNARTTNSYNQWTRGFRDAMLANPCYTDLGQRFNNDYLLHALSLIEGDSDRDDTIRAKNLSQLLHYLSQDPLLT